MSLESKKFILKDVKSSFNGHPITFTPEIVGDREVYSILNQNNEHCGYMTEEMLNTILKQNKKEDVENNIITNSLFVDANDGKEEPTTFAQKIILDKFKGVTPLNIELYPVKYEENAKPLVMQVEEEYNIKNSGKKLGLDFIQQENISCNNFIFFNKVPTNVNINIDSESSTFKDIHFFHLENSPGKDHEINLYLSSVMMDSLTVANLTFNGLSEDIKGAYYLAFKANGSSLIAEKMKIKLPSVPPREEKYCKLSSLKKNIKIYNIDLTFLEPGDSLAVEKNVDLKGVNLFIDGSNKIDGNLKFDGDIRNRGTLKIKNLKSYSSLLFKTRDYGFFELRDSTLDNGKKNIVFTRGENYLTNVNIKNEGKSELTFDHVNIKNSDLTNISNLANCNMANTNALNFSLKFGEGSGQKPIFSFGPTKEHPKNGAFSSRGIFCSLKNTVVELDGENFFIDETKGSLHLNNSIIKGATLIETTKDEGSHSLTIDNSILDNAHISLARNDEEDQEVTTTISNSEIKRDLHANELREIKDSMIENSSFDKIYEINSSTLSSASIKGEEGNHIINGSIDREGNSSIGQATDDLELL